MMKKHDLTLRQVRRLVRALHPKAHIDKVRFPALGTHRIGTDMYVVLACCTVAASKLSSWQPTEARAWREAAQRITDRIVSL